MRRVPLEWLTEAYQILIDGRWDLAAIERAENYLKEDLPATRRVLYLNFGMWLDNEGFHAL